MVQDAASDPSALGALAEQDLVIIEESGRKVTVDMATGEITVEQLDELFEQIVDVAEEVLGGAHEVLQTVAQLDADRFVIDTDEKAAWAGRKRAEAEAEKARVVAAFKPEIDKLNDRLRREVARSDRTIEFMEELLKTYGRKVGVSSKGVRRYPVAYAAIKWSDGRDSVEVFDEDAFIAWALEGDRWDLLKVEAGRQKLKDALKPNTEYPGLVLMLKDGERDDGDGDDLVVKVFLDASGTKIPGVRLVREGSVTVSSK